MGQHRQAARRGSRYPGVYCVPTGDGDVSWYVRWKREGHDQGRRLRSHGSDVSKILGSGLMPDVMCFGPVATEVAALDEHVGGHHDAPVGTGEHGRVVTGTHGQAGQGTHRPEDALHDRDLPEVTHRLCRHAASCPPIARPRAIRPSVPGR